MLVAVHRSALKGKKPKQLRQNLSIRCAEINMKIRETGLLILGSGNLEPELMLAQSVSRRPTDGSLDPRQAESLFIK